MKTYHVFWSDGNGTLTYKEILSDSIANALLSALKSLNQACEIMSIDRVS